jgi:uncharacterized protein YodC (DUF2158 family)
MEHSRELEDVDDSSYAFFKQIRMQTWGRITGPIREWYHDAGEYYQVVVECHFLDGCGEVKSATFHLSAGKDEDELRDKFRNEYQPGSLHLIDSDSFNLLDNDITFYHPSTTPISLDDGAYVLKWFDDYNSNRISQPDDHINISGKICECRVVQTKSGKEMAFVMFSENPDTSIIIFVDQYAEYRDMLQIGNNMDFIGKFDSYTNPKAGVTQSNFFVKEISAVIGTTTSETE